MPDIFIKPIPAIQRTQQAKLAAAVASAKHGRTSELAQLITQEQAKRDQAARQTYRGYRLWRGRSDEHAAGVVTEDYFYSQSRSAEGVIVFDCPDQEFVDAVNDAARRFALTDRLQTKHAEIFRMLQRDLFCGGSSWKEFAGTGGSGTGGGGPAGFVTTYIAPGLEAAPPYPPAQIALLVIQVADLETVKAAATYRMDETRGEYLAATEGVPLAERDLTSAALAAAAADARNSWKVVCAYLLEARQELQSAEAAAGRVPAAATSAGKAGE